MRLRGLYKLPDGRDWPWEKLGLSLVGRALLSKALIQLSLIGGVAAPSILVFWLEVTQPWAAGLMVSSKSAYAKMDLSRPAAASALISVVSPS